MLCLSGVAVTVNQEITATNLSNLTFVLTTNFNGATAFGWNGYDGQVYAATDASVNLSLTAVNDALSFNAGVNQTVLEDSGARSVSNWAAAISAGPSDDSGQVLTFTVSNNNAALFAAQPALSPIGTLTFTPVANASGSATITVTLQDNGGTANGGQDTSAPQSFTITLTAVNDAPFFTKGSDQSVMAGSGAQIVNGWATAISAGPSNEASQVLTFTITTTNNALFSALPAIDPATGALTYTPATGQWGTVTVTVALQDNGGTAQLRITVLPRAGSAH